MDTRDERLNRLVEVITTLAFASVPEQSRTVHEKALESAARHGAVRRAQGSSTEEILKEYYFLRHALWALIHEHVSDPQSASKAIGQIDQAATLTSRAALLVFTNGSWRRANGRRRGSASTRPVLARSLRHMVCGKIGTPGILTLRRGEYMGEKISQGAAPDAAEALPEQARRISREEQDGRPGTFLARASRLLASSLDYERTLRTVAGLALPDLGAWCIVDIVEHETGGPTMRRLAIVHPEPDKEEITRRLEESWPPETEDPIGAPVVLRTRESEVISRVTDEMLRQAARSEENLRDLRQLGIGSFMVVPLIARDQVLGAMTFISPKEGEVYTEEHLGPADNLAAVCALAIDNARHHRDAVQAQNAAGSERDARRYVQAIVDTVREPLLVLDQQLRVQTANRSFYRIFETSPEETEGRLVYDIGNGDWNNPPLRILLEEIIPEQTELEDFEIKQVFERLGHRTMLLNARSLHRPHGEVESILLAIEDVTERRRAEEERKRLLERERAAKEEAEQAVRARKQILSIVSHDLRSPLNVIYSSVEILQMLPPEERREKEEERFQAIVRSAERMNRLIGDLLDMSRIEAGRFSVQTAPVDLAALLEEACLELRSRAEEEGLALRCEVPEDLPRISADRDRILQVIENLVSNALKFTPAEGRVILRAEPGGAEVRLSVSDTGPGIPEEEQEHLFDPFWQAEDTAEGAGLGLFISKGIVEAHGGEIRVESEMGEGTTFHFTIPVARTEQA